MNSKIIKKIILKWICENYGKSEKEDPCYNINMLSTYLEKELRIDKTMEDLHQLVEDFIDYTRTWSIGETEWYYNVDCARKNAYGKKYITHEEFEIAIREEILYCFIYNIDSIKDQMENDLCVGYEEERFNKVSKDMERKIQKLFKDFKIERN